MGSDTATTVSAEEFDTVYAAVRNWGRWGAGDQLGTLNLVTPVEAAAAAALVRDGRTVSMAHDLDVHPAPDNHTPALHFMTQRGDLGAGEPRINTDFVGTAFHGKSVTHLDALCHCIYRGSLYNGVDPAECVTSAGSSFGSVLTASAGIVSRGVLIDAPRLRDVPWLEPGMALHAEDLKRAVEAAGLRLRRGDVVLVRTGARRRRRELGPWDPSDSSAGLHPDAMAWLHAHDVAVLGSDGDSDARPSPVEGVQSPIHVLALTAMGMPLLDNVNLEDVTRVCAELGRWEFCCVLAPLRLPGGTGSPLNPLALF
ncbi:cyclase family protein [Geodermatophilus sp. SYSU D00703]